LDRAGQRRRRLGRESAIVTNLWFGGSGTTERAIDIWAAFSDELGQNLPFGRIDRREKQISCTKTIQ
jgi:hypothetical protein